MKAACTQLLQALEELAEAVLTMQSDLTLGFCHRKICLSCYLGFTREIHMSQLVSYMLVMEIENINQS